MTALIEEAYLWNRGAPGRRPRQGPSMAALDGSTRRLVQIGRASGRPLSLRVYSQLLANARRSRGVATSSLGTYVSALVLKEFANGVEWIANSVEREHGEDDPCGLVAEFRSSIRVF